MGLGKSEYKNFANIIADGTIRVQTEESNPDAVKREYELSDKTKGVKFELVYNFLSGIITNIQIFDGQYGKNLQITIDGIILSMNMASNFAEDIMKKIPNVNLGKEVKFIPYSFEDDNKKLRRGVSIVQNNTKILNFFYNPATKENCNGFPEMPVGWEKFSSDDWKIYFITTRKFLQQYLEESIIPNLVYADIELTEEQEDGTVAATVSEDGEIHVEDIPFDDPVSTSNPTEAVQPATGGVGQIAPEPAPTTSAPTQPTLNEAPVAPTTAVPPHGNPVTDAGGIEIAIANFAKTKLGVVNDADVQRVVMETFGMAYIDSNKTAILEKLQAMPVK